MALVSVYRAADEFSALTIRDMLRENGIGSMIRSHQIPGYGIPDMRSGGSWGEVQVEEQDVNRAQELIGAFRGTLGELAEAQPIDMPEEE